MATIVQASPSITLATRLDALSLTGDQVSRADRHWIVTMSDLMTAMCDPVNRRQLVNGSTVIDLALLEYIDDDTSDALEKLAMSFTPRHANLTALVGPAGTGANPTVTAHGNSNSTQIQKNWFWRLWDWDWN